MNMMELTQLSMQASIVDAGYNKEMLKAPSDAYNNLIVTLATANPLWRFVVKSIHPYNKHVREVTVFQHGEELGYIEWDYFRGDYGFEIGNDRIERARERTRAYRTHDEKKALSAIKKTFSPKNIGERVKDAVEQTDKLLINQMWEKNRKCSESKNALNMRAYDFAQHQIELFKTFLSNRNESHILSGYNEAVMEMQTLKDLHDNMGKCSIVIQVDSGYIVKTGDKVEMMDDTTLPHHMKAKLGMLKLVEDSHFITNIGGKVKADVFVLSAEGDEQ